VKYIDEFRNPEIAGKIITRIHQKVTRHWVIMEICGGQTHSILKNGIDQVLPDQIELVHGPGCPVCVTPLEMIDKALAIASQPGVIFTSFGDMLRVPGTSKDLLMVKSEGADVRVVYSPLEALTLARENPDKEVVFFAVGFETTVPGNAMALFQAAHQRLNNFSLLVSHVLVPPAIEALLSSDHNRVQAYLAPGHVCTVMGWEDYIPVSEKYKVPIVVTGFEPVDILEGISMCIDQLEHGHFHVENQYVRSVKKQGNQAAQDIMNKVFHVTDRKWRGIGHIPLSGLKIRKEYAPFDAEIKFEIEDIQTEESTLCMSGLILQGLKKPFHCPAFGAQCTPAKPLGATMVSSEGACSAYFKYHRR
jgi:hydrogenase expression/formation protein HypD